jgi:hypothetical protein
MGRTKGADHILPMRRFRFGQLALGAVGAGMLIVASAGSGSAQSGCSVYSALAAAAGVRTVQSAPGLLLTTDADANLPAAQAQANSLSGSKGWAGAPYSSTAAENMTASGRSANDVPVFAVSSYPTEPKAGRSTPAATIEAKSGPQSSTALVVGGGPALDQASVGRVTTSAASACEEDATVRAVADNKVETVDINGVLRIGSVRSHAQAVVEPDGQRKLVGRMEVEGAMVLGQPVAITDRGLVIGESTTPLPENPLGRALEEAGISVRYITAVKNAEQGEVFAPGLEVVVTRVVEGVGTGPVTSTYLLGRAHARAAATLGQADATVETAVSGTPVLSELSLEEAGPGGAAGGAASATPKGSSEATVSAPPASTVPTRIANSSLAGVYGGMGLGVLFVAAWLVFDRMVVRFRSR